MTSLDQEQEIQRRHEAWRSLDIEQQNVIRSGLVAATERCRNHTVLVLREPADAVAETALISFWGQAFLPDPVEDKAY